VVDEIYSNNFAVIKNIIFIPNKTKTSELIDCVIAAGGNA